MRIAIDELPIHLGPPLGIAMLDDPPFLKGSRLRKEFEQIVVDAELVCDACRFLFVKRRSSRRQPGVRRLVV